MLQWRQAHGPEPAQPRGTSGHQGPRAEQPCRPQLQSWGRDGKRWIWTSRPLRLCLVTGSQVSQAAGFSDKESSFKPYRMLTLLYKPSSYMKAGVQGNRNRPPPRHVVCGQHNSLNQEPFRNQEELSVSKHVFVVPMNHLLVHAHKQPDARARKLGTGPSAP